MMRTMFTHLSLGSRSLSWFLGFAVLAAALASWMSGLNLAGIRGWILDVFGISFSLLFVVMNFGVFFCWSRMLEAHRRNQDRRVWREAALHGANGVATLALTYTLLGISLGIGTLADQELTTETVQQIIRSLTDHFSLAFMTTVVGLPVSAALRALISVSEARMAATTGP